MTIAELLDKYKPWWNPNTRILVWLDGKPSEQSCRVGDLPRLYPYSEYEVKEFGFDFIEFSTINRDKIDYEYFESVVSMWYNILGEHAERQNAIKIKRWYEGELITKDEMISLIKYNNKLSRFYYN